MRLLQLLEDRVEFLTKRYEKSLNEYEKSLSDYIDRRYAGRENNDAKHLIRKFQTWDPTRNDKYLEWIIIRVLNGSIKLEDGYKIQEYLQLFDDNKRRLPIEHRDINRIRNGAELFKIIEPYTEKARSEQNLAIQDQLKKEVKLLLNDEIVRVLIPLTMRASCYYGTNTEWCTAHQNSAYNAFDQHNDKGSLYIIEFKGTEEKYQFHFPTEQFMDKDDNPIGVEGAMGGYSIRDRDKLPQYLLELLGRHKPLFDLFQQIFRKEGFIEGVMNLGETEAIKLITDDPNNFKKIQKHLVTEKTAMAAVTNSGLMLELVPEEFRTKAVSLAAVHNAGAALIYVPTRIRHSIPEINEVAVKQNAKALKFVPDHMKSFEMMLRAVSQEDNESILPMIPMYDLSLKKFKAIIIAAIKHNGMRLSYVKYTMIRRQSKGDHFSPKFIHKLNMLAVSNDGDALSAIPKEQQTKELIFKAADNMATDFSIFSPMDHVLIDLTDDDKKNLYKIIVDNGWELDRVPKQYWTEQLLVSAVLQDYKAIDEIDNRTPEIIRAMITDPNDNSKISLAHIERDYQYVDVIKAAIEIEPKLITDVKSHELLLDMPELVQMAYDKDPTSIDGLNINYRERVIK